MLDGRVIAVTGCASGIGAATVLELKRQGAFVIGLDRVAPARGAVAQFVECDLADPVSVEHAAAALPDRLDGLCNVAGVSGKRAARTVIAVNLLGALQLTELCLPRLPAGSAIVNVASAAGQGWAARQAMIDELLDLDRDEALARVDEWFADGAAAYDFSKEALIVATMRQSRRLRPLGIRSNSVSPGAVETPILPEFYETMDGQILDALKEVAGGRNGEPKEVAAVIAFLLSPAASWVNGADLLVDGGAEVAVKLGEIDYEPTGITQSSS